MVEKPNSLHLAFLGVLVFLGCPYFSGCYGEKISRKTKNHVYTHDFGFSRIFGFGSEYQRVLFGNVNHGTPKTKPPGEKPPGVYTASIATSPLILPLLPAVLIADCAAR
jgi:hypothetical protein